MEASLMTVSASHKRNRMLLVIEIWKWLQERYNSVWWRPVLNI